MRGRTSGSWQWQSAVSLIMAKQRYINTFFWDDSYIEDLCPHGKLLFIYLITTPLTNIAGSFEITVKKMSDHTGLLRDEIVEMLKRFEADGKVIYRDRWLLMVNTIEHQNTENAKIRTGIATIINESPQWVKDVVPYESYMTHQETSHLNLNSNLNLNSKDGVAVATVAETAVNGSNWIDAGIELLKTAQMTEAQARPFLGRLAKDHTAAEMLTAIQATSQEKPADAKAFLIGVLKKRAKDRARGQVGKDRGVTYEPDPPCRFCGADCCLKDHRAEIDAEAENNARRRATSGG